jgi:RND family efflux transporter MFP subunit
MRKVMVRIVLALALVAIVGVVGKRVLSPVPVPAVVVAPTEICGTVKGPGTVQSKVQVTISGKITGILTRLHADQGDAVKMGQVLAELDSTELKSRTAAAQSAKGRSEQELARARADLLKAEANLALARSNHERNQEVFGPGYLPASAFDASKSALRVAESEVASGKAVVEAIQATATQTVHEAEATKDILGYTRILAPMDGLIITRNAEIGTILPPGAPIFQMVDYQIWAASWIDERMIADVRVGQKASIVLRSGRTFEGEVARLGSAADTVTRELEVDVKFSTLPNPLVIGEESEVIIDTGRVVALAIPLSAIQTRNGTQGVLVITEGRARFRPVVTGAHDDHLAAVLKGLQEGDIVALNPANIAPGKKVWPQLDAQAVRKTD